MLLSSTHTTYHTPRACRKWHYKQEVTNCLCGGGHTTRHTTRQKGEPQESRNALQKQEVRPKPVTTTKSRFTYMF